jgi:hypothetical protein
LREICVISGTDYNLSNNNVYNHDLFTSLKLFKKYKAQKICSSFYDWLIENTNYIIDDYEFFMKNCYMFELNDHLKEFEQIKVANKNVLFSEMKNILQKDGFIFVN